MKADTLEILEYLGGGGKYFRIPVYQRNYDWKKNIAKNFSKI
jgi:uncharacterized protein with ParB-like and HNH nuclease domain